MDPRSFGRHIMSLIEKKDLDEKTSYEMFSDVLLNRQSEVQQGAFLAALVAKGETVDELYGAWKAIYELDTIKVQTSLPGPLVENSGTGMDNLYTFNVSTASAIVASSLGVIMVRHGARALTSKCGTVDILEALGLDVEAPVEKVAESVKEAGIGLFNGMSAKVHPGALARILSKMYFGSTFNISASLASPVIPQLAIRGVYSSRIIEKMANLMKRIGYEKGMVAHGEVEGLNKGMDEISPCGKTKVIEFSRDKMTRYELEPEDFGIPRCKLSDIQSKENMEEEVKRFLLVLAGKGSEACVNFTAINAGAILYIAEKCGTLLQGKEMAQEAMVSGRAIKKLVQWVSIQDHPEKKGLNVLLKLLEDLGLKNFL
ncbi:MAG: anthranilate phosphoribosyltransferase [Deltaproteobacteria bacterium]|nr:anthranilate phosphoribosyltransferase [Deltaproteobacteria bacterium]